MQSTKRPWWPELAVGFAVGLFIDTHWPNLSLLAFLLWGAIGTFFTVFMLNFLIILSRKL